MQRSQKVSFKFDLNITPYPVYSHAAQLAQVNVVKLYTSVEDVNNKPIINIFISMESR